MKRLIFLFLFFSLFAKAQKVVVYQINADWNKKNTLELNLKNCRYIYANIEDIAPKVKESIKSLPAILIVKEGRNYRQFVAGLNFKLRVKEKEIQDIINKLNND